MVGWYLRYAVAYFLCKMAMGIPVVNQKQNDVDNQRGFKYEEYLIEHEISTNQAKDAIKNMTKLNSIVQTPPDCQKCTESEIQYCQGGKLIDDHCCCDRRYHEYFPFIPHTCYTGTTQCKPQAQDCDTYIKRRKCCCDKYALEKWMEKSQSIRSTSFVETKFIILLYFVNMCII